MGLFRLFGILWSVYLTVCHLSMAMNQLSKKQRQSEVFTIVNLILFS